jgi:hypothetical protein
VTKPVGSSEAIPALGKLREEFVRAAQADSRSTSRGRVPRLAAGLAAAGAIVAIAIVVDRGDEPTAPSVSDRAATPGDTAGSLAPAPQLGQGAAPDVGHGGFAAYEPQFQTVEALAQASTLVISGTVKDVRPGGEVVDIDPEYPTRFIDTLVGVDEVLKGSAASGEVTVKSIELAYANPPGTPAGTPDREWRAPGERVVAFLTNLGSGPIFGPTSYAHSLYRIKGADIEVLSQAPGSLSERIASMSLSELRSAVRGAGN